VRLSKRFGTRLEEFEVWKGGKQKPKKPEKKKKKKRTGKGDTTAGAVLTKLGPGARKEEKKSDLLALRLQ